MTIFHPRIITRCFTSISGLIRLLRAAVLCSVIPGFLVLSGTSFIQPVQAQDNAAASAETDTRMFDIPAGPLDSALDRFARTAGVNLTYDPALISNRVTRGLSGRHDVSAGLMLLLAGNNIEVIRQPGGGYTLHKIPATRNPAADGKAVLPTMTVKADSLKQGTAEEGYRVSNISGIGLWGERSLRDTPYSMSVVPSDLIENINAQNMGQIFKMNPLTQEPPIQNFTGVPMVVMRGFYSSNPVYDGIPLALGNGSAVSVIEIDRVEILGGTSGFLYGGGRVGGAINYVTKSPTSVPLRRLTFGNYGGTQFYGHADISGKFDDRGRFGYRANLLYQGGDTAIGEPVKQKVANIVLDGHLTDTLYADVKYTYNDYSKEATQPTFNSVIERTGVDTSKRYSPKWASNDLESHKAYTSLRWDPSKYFTLRSAFFYQHTNMRTNQIYLNEQANRTFIPRMLNAPWEKHENYGGYIYLDTRFSTFAVDHKLTLGYSSTYYEYFLRGNGFVLRSGTS
ncbi:TonB-dependent siderophore receptor, partial [Nitrosomonas europaea]